MRSILLLRAFAPLWLTFFFSEAEKKSFSLFAADTRFVKALSKSNVKYLFS